MAEPRRMGDVVNYLLSRRGYAQVQASQSLESSILAVIEEPLRGMIRVGKLKAGTLELFVADSASLQELSWAKAGILQRIKEALPDSKINKLKLSIG
jgi:hypothetical protein